MLTQLYKPFQHWSNKGTIWIYSDTHFDDEELAAGVPNRPSAEEQVRLINSKVGKNDTLILLGDVGNIEWVKKLRGYKVLICGNHDKGVTNYQKQNYSECFCSNEYSISQAIEVMRNKYPGYRISLNKNYDDSIPDYLFLITATNDLFDEVYEGPLMIGEKIILSHEPLDINWAFNIHGHNHTKTPNQRCKLNVCSDVINYTPINFNQFVKSGRLTEVETIHRETIDKATERRKKKETIKNKIIERNKKMEFKKNK